VDPDHVGLERLAELVDAGLLRPHVEHAVPLAEAAKAHEILETTSAIGKTVLVV
jgi:NADPH:quinone reductase-like Zn-dependent oxidoreductase